MHLTKVEEVCRADLAVNLTRNADVNKVFAFSQTQLGYKTLMLSKLANFLL